MPAFPSPVFSLLRVLWMEQRKPLTPPRGLLPFSGVIIISSSSAECVLLGMTSKLCGRGAATWITAVGVRGWSSAFFFLVLISYAKKNPQPPGNNKHNVQALLNSFDREKLWKYLFFRAFNPISDHQILRYYRNRAMWSEDLTARVH